MHTRVGRLESRRLTTRFGSLHQYPVLYYTVLNPFSTVPIQTLFQLPLEKILHGIALVEEFLQNIFTAKLRSGEAAIDTVFPTTLPYYWQIIVLGLVCRFGHTTSEVAIDRNYLVCCGAQTSLTKILTSIRKKDKKEGTLNPILLVV